MIAFVRKLIHVGKKLFIVGFVLTLFAFSIPLFFQSSSIPHQTDEFEKDRKEIYKSFYDPANQQNKQQKALIELSKTFACRVVGELCSANPDEAREYFKQSNVGEIAYYTSLPLVNPPASGVYWVYDSLQQTGFVPKTYAAEGVGFASIKRLAPIWKIFRNITFLLLSLLVTVIGILIILRFKINPQTIVTLENSLPRIFLTLIFITFSFPIAGFFIDLMYIVILIGVTIFQQAASFAFPADQIGEVQRNMTGGSLNVVWDGLFPITGTIHFGSVPFIGKLLSLFRLGSALLDILPGFINDIFRSIAGVFLLLKLYTVVFSHTSAGFLTDIASMLKNISILGFSGGELLSSTLQLNMKIMMFAVLFPLFLVYGAGWIIGIFIFATMLFLFIRIFVMLFATYIRILLFIIFSPLIILPNLLPGKNGFVHWVRLIIGEISVFPTLVFILLTGRLLVFVFAGTTDVTGGPIGNSSNLWRPPFLSSIGRHNLAILVGMALIFAVPDICRFVKQKISGSKGIPFNIGPSIFFGGLAAAGGGALGMAGKFGGIAHAASAFKDGGAFGGVWKGLKTKLGRT